MSTSERVSKAQPKTSAPPRVPPEVKLARVIFL